MSGNGPKDDFGSTGVASAKVASTGEGVDNGLSRRRTTITAGKPQRQPSTTQDKNRWQNARSPKHKYRSYQILKRVVFAAVSVLIGRHIVNGNGSLIMRTLRGCAGAQKSSQSFVLVASHLRQGPDGELRLRIIEHNLHLLFSDNDMTKPLKSIVIFSLDGSEKGVHGMVDKWRRGAAKGFIDDVIFVKNDAVLVDASKWVAALYQILPDIRRTNARVMLMNDSFLLVRSVPELLDDGCGGVCGLVWTGANTDPTRHIQSYIRSISACEVDSYIRFYEKTKGSVHNVNELIQLFEVNLGWASGTVSAVYDYAGAHPDADEAQKVLIHRGYPAIKLKKFFVTDDLWLSEDESSRTRLPPSFSADVYKKMNHDLNHLSEDDLKNHFASSGKHEDRIYSTQELVIKHWIKDELMKMGACGKSTMLILEDYLALLKNRVIAISGK